MDSQGTFPRPAVDQTYRKGFWSLFVTQFQDAFSDNLYRFVIVFFLHDWYIKNDNLTTAQQQQSLSFYLMSVSTVLFAIPYLLLPGFAGSLADRFSKQKIILFAKVSELCIMIVGLIAFLNPHPVLIWAMLVMMFTQSGFLNPAKYGILPEMLPEGRLSWGNGIIMMGTFAAIVSGQAIAGYLHQYVNGEMWKASIVLVALSGFGMFTAMGISKVPAAAPERRLTLMPWSGVFNNLKLFWRDRYLFTVLVGGTFFWFVSALLQQNILTFGKVTLELDSARAGLMVAVISIGIGLGCAACGFMSRNRIEVGLVPFGLAGFAGLNILVGLVPITYPLVFVPLFFLGFFAGFIDVPLEATLQSRSPKALKGAMIATYNIFTCTGILVSGLVVMALSSFVTPNQIFLIAAASSLGMGIYIVVMLPAAFLRLFLWLPANTLYSLRVNFKQNVPDHGGALLVANHVSFIDALAITASLDRPVRFIMADEIYKVWWVRPIAHIMRAIPISSNSGPRELVHSLKSATEAIQNGELVCIFAEGQITRTGQLLPFKKGFERIMKGVEAPIIPVHLDQLWGSIFSFADGKFFWKWPRRIPYPIAISYGEPMPADSDSAEVRLAVQTLGTRGFAERPLEHPLLHRAFIRTARKYLFRIAMADGKVPRLSFFKALVGSIALARKLKYLLGPEEMTGILLPQSVGGALTNVALTMMGKVTVNLNYTASAQSMASAVQQCGIRHVLTAHEFLKRFPIDVPGEVIYMEEVKQSISGKDRLIAMILALFCPTSLLERLVGSPANRSEEDLATIIFSSGSEGDPKGVMLTHRNVLSNVEGVAQVFPHKTGDGIMGILPFFHSFGYMGTLWLPLWRGFFTVYHPNPLEPKIIGQLIYKYRPIFLIATPTFLQGFIRRCLPEELSSLQYVVTGAEKLPERVREAFLHKFGVEPLEGYGTTECAPAVSINVPDFRAPGFYQVGLKRGTIGKPLPGVSVKVIDPDTEEVLPVGSNGLLCVKGPNIMKGYLKQPDRTAKVLKEGWYNTGDIANVDDDGFITITDRLARFSKIGGEMVPHNKIEETLHELLDIHEQTFAVTSVPDEQKGERIVVLHTLMDGELEILVDKLKDSDLPNLWRPKATSFYRIAEIPVLGTGKLDLKKMKQLAAEMDLGD
ncbi:MAG: hypothetical protein AMXMBFR84_13950 [Candidatus Hydrogenedentota bacterium]